MNVTDDDLNKALDRIARTEDGHLLYLYFQRVVCEVMSPPFFDGALPAHAGRRKFAADLMGLMAKGIRESDRTGSACITFAVTGPRAIARAGGAGRRVTLDTPVAGYDAAESGE